LFPKAQRINENIQKEIKICEFLGFQIGLFENSLLPEETDSDHSKEHNAFIYKG